MDGPKCYPAQGYPNQATTNTRLSTHFSAPPAHPRVLFHLGSLDPSPNKTTRVVVVASALRSAVWPLLPRPQRAELINRAPLPCSWPRAWEPSGDGPRHPSFLQPRSSSTLHCSALSECQGSDIVAPHHPPNLPVLPRGTRTCGICITTPQYPSTDLLRFPIHRLHTDFPTPATNH